MKELEPYVLDNATGRVALPPSALDAASLVISVPEDIYK